MLHGQVAKFEFASADQSVLRKLATEYGNWGENMQKRRMFYLLKGILVCRVLLAPQLILR